MGGWMQCGSGRGVGWRKGERERGRDDLHYILTKPFPPLSLLSVSPIPVGGEGHQSSLSLSLSLSGGEGKVG